MQYMNFSDTFSSINQPHQVETFVVYIQEKSLHETDILSSLANKYVCTVGLSRYLSLFVLFWYIFSFFLMFSFGL